MMYLHSLDPGVKRTGAMHVPISFSRPLEDLTVPTKQAAMQLCSRT